MRKEVLLIFAVVATFVFFVASFPCHAAKKSNTQVIQPVGDDGVINGCYKKVNGQLRVINSTDICGPSEGSISWNQAGQSGLIDLTSTYVKTCQNITDCFCDNNGWVLHGYATCPPNAVLSTVGTPMDAADYGFHAICMNLDGSYTNPVAITIRCVGSSAETNCTDGVDNEGDGLIDCSDADCASDTACLPAPVENCTDGIDNDTDGAIDCSDADCSSDPACLPVPVENCTDAIDNDIDGLIDCDDADCASDLACQIIGNPGHVENCTDEIDNDGDGSTDCNDSNCSSDPICKKKKK